MARGPVRPLKARESVGAIVPDALIAWREAADDTEAEGIVICRKMIDEPRAMDGVPGTRPMTPGLLRGIVEILQG